MTLKEIVAHIALKEGRKRESPVGDIREIVAIFCDLLASEEGEEALAVLMKNGKRRAKRKHG